MAALGAYLAGLNFGRWLRDEWRTPLFWCSMVLVPFVFWPFALLLVLIKLPGALLERFGWVVLCMGRGRDDLSGWGFRRRPPSPPHDLPGWAVRCPWVELQLFKLHRDD